MKVAKLISRYFVYSIIIIIITVLFIPGINNDGFSFSYGLPIHFFNLFPNQTLAQTDILISKVSINILYLVINIVIISCFIGLIEYFIKKVRSKKRMQNKV